MKTRTSNVHNGRRISQGGKVLVTTLFIALLVALTVGGLLQIANQQSILTHRSMVWGGELPVAEAGVEEAMTQINARPEDWTLNGWSQGANKVHKTRVLGDGYYSVTIITSTPPVIVSIGYGRIPLQTNFTSRAVLCTTALGPPAWGIVARKQIIMSGISTVVDSYDSSNPLFSGPGGVYTVDKRRDRAGVATISSARPAINTGDANVYGSVATGPGGSAVGDVGDGTWLATSTGIQPGHFFDDFNMAIMSVALPAGLDLAPQPSGGMILGTNYGYVLPNGDYRLSSLTLSAKSLYVAGKARLYIPGDVKISGGAAILLGPNASLELYLGGDVSFGGRGFLSASSALNCSVFGLPTCTRIKYGGTAAWTARVYAPSASIEMGGGSEFFGSMLGDSISFQGTPGIHYDEALGQGSPDFRIVTWEEM